MQANLGSISRTFLFGFTQPYVRNRPINVGFQIFNNKQDYNAAKNYQATTGASLNLSDAEKSLTQNYNVGSDGINFSVSYPLKRHAFQRVGMTYSLTQSTITAFSTASQTFFQTIAFRSGMQGSNPLAGIINSSVSFSYSYNTVSNPLRPREGKEYTAFVQAAGLWGNVRYVNPVVAYKRFIPMHYLTSSTRRAATCWACARSWATSRASAATWRRPTTASTPAARWICAASTCAAPRPTATCPRASTSSSPIPTAVAFPATRPTRRTTSASRCRCPIYGIASVGGDTNLTTNVEYRIPVVGPFTFAFFDDFGIDAALNHGQLKQSPEGFASLTAPLYGCPVFNNGACQGGIPGSQVGFKQNIHPGAGHQLRAAHVARRRDLGDHADHQRALPALLRL